MTNLLIAVARDERGIFGLGCGVPGCLLPVITVALIALFVLFAL